MLKLITKNTIKFNTQTIIRKYQSKVNKISKRMLHKELPGQEMMGWVDLVEDINNHEILAMRKQAREWITKGIKKVVIIGIGGSYVGVRASIDMCTAPFDNQIEFIWVHNISSTYITSLLKSLNKQKFAIIIISKSGTTLEPALAFQLLRKQLEKNVGATNLNKLIVAITDYHRGTLHDFAKEQGYTMFGIPDNVGGRFSTLTAVGLFPMLLKGIDPIQVLKGAKQALKDTESSSLLMNSAFLYACYRNYLYKNKKLSVENFVVYDPNLTFVAEMWKQMFGESEGKNHLSLYPSISLFTTDLHSLGQYLQDGTRNFFETTLSIANPKLDIKIKVEDNKDGIKYLNGMSLNTINKKAFIGTVAAHTEQGKVNNLIIQLDTNDAYHFGYLFIWFAKAVTMGGYLLHINPFDQPGVEAYKKNMFQLLGK